MAAAAAASSSSSQPMTSTQVMYYMPLYRASMEGDWESAKRFFDSDPNAFIAPIDESGNTALCIASRGSRQIKFIEKLVELMPAEALALQDTSGQTPLHHIAVNGNTNAAKLMVNKNPNLTQIRNNFGSSPLSLSAVYGHKELLLYLCSVTRDEDPSPFRGRDGASLLHSTIEAELYDVALHLLGQYPEMATTRNLHGNYNIFNLSMKSWPSWPSYMSAVPEIQNAIFANALQQLVSIVPRIKKLYDAKILHKQYLTLVAEVCDQVTLMSDIDKIHEALFGSILIATQFGNLDYIKLILKVDPRQIWSINNLTEGVLHSAIRHRQANVFIYLKDFGLKEPLADRLNRYQDTILHTAAKLAPPSKLQRKSGAALQMQYELQWYKEVEKIVQPHFKDWRNVKGEKPRETFTKEHENLLKEGEKWMKDMAYSSMVVATLIATVVFTAAFTVPGGNITDKGIPIFLHTRSYMTFAVSNALALFSSLTSVLMFLSILTGRYAEQDFHKSLPLKLIIGLAMLFIAIATMTIAFSATYFIMLGRKLEWVSTLVALLTCIPVTLFALLQFPLFIEMVRSTYRSNL